MATEVVVSVAMKTCRDCGRVKSLSEFYKHPGMTDGHLNSCKQCRRNYAVSRDRREADRKRNRTPERKAHIRANAEKWRKKHPDRYRAHNAANNAIRDGKLKRQACQKCGSEEFVHKHHRDYSKPLKVVWLCAQCHSREHNPF